MAAAYRPYKDEDSCDNLNTLDDDGLNWPDNEPASLQIYERTTEELPFSSNRRYLIACLGLATISLFIGLMIGYFAHSSHNECVPSLAVSLHSVRHEDPTICDKLKNLISKDNIDKLVKEFSSEPRIPGSPRDLYLVSKIRDYFIESSFDKVSIDNYTVLLSLPDSSNPNSVQVVNDKTNESIFNSLDELKLDFKQPHPFSAYSPSADIKGDLIFVNNGLQEDYLLLDKKYSIQFDGLIALVKLGKLPLDQIVHIANDFNVSGVVFFPDHKFFEVDHSDYKFPGDAIKWESALWNEFGDPLTPYYPSTTHAHKQTTASFVAPLPRIPVHPLSSNQANRLLHLLGGMKLPSEWGNGSDFNHRIGPGFANKAFKIRLKVNNQLKEQTVSNVFGYIKGRVEPDRYILFGNHRDSLTTGAMDAASGAGVMLEIARAFGQLIKGGWRPRRTIIFCSWGAEEFNLMGSTEWLEDKYKLLHARGIVYINADTLVTGNDSLRAFASPLLYHSIFNATKLIANPDQSDYLHRTVFDKWYSTFPRIHNETISKRSGFIQKNSHEMDLFFGEHDIFADLLTKEETLSRLNHISSSYLLSYLEGVISHRQPQVLPIQGRSVYSSFTSYLGIPSMDLSYVSSDINHESSSPSVYSLIHTQYDTYELIKSTLDPHFIYHQTMAQIYAEIIRDFADSLFIPFNLLHYVEFIQEIYLKIYAESQQLFPQGDFNTDMLSSAIHNFTESVYNFHLRQGSIDFSDPMAIRAINDQLLLLERTFLDPVHLALIKKIHLIQSPSSFNSDGDQSLVSLISKFAQIFSNATSKDFQKEIKSALKARLSILIHALQNAADEIDSVV